MARHSLRYHIALAVLLILAGLGLYAGWRLFWFLTDDAFIAFRYISNAHFGFGYVWNPPPFKPVEGYTSFLWVALLDVVWRLTGVEPPASANNIALLFAAGTLLLCAGMVLRLRLSPALERCRLAILALVLLGTLTNRTFLAWTSSGLETAMFNFWLTAWVFLTFSTPPGTTRWMAGLTTSAVLMELTRPDGLLFLAATLVLVAAGLRQYLRTGRFRRVQFLVLLPLLAAIAHQLWRVATYGAWLPNTYAAKYVGPWPESGVRYLLAFIIEYSLWFWLAIALFFGLAMLRRARALTRSAREMLARDLLGRPLQPALVQAVAAGTLFAHFAYYTIIIGGDHFEYRVYSQLVPLLLISFVWFLNALALRPAWALGLMLVSLAAGLPIPWTHWALTQRYTTRLETLDLHLPIAPAFPSVVQPYVGVFDGLQYWLIEHAVGVRHQEHKIFYQVQSSIMPPRQAGLLLSSRVQAVRVEGAVGVLSWVLPTAAIVDAHGLNDLVIARNPIDPDGPRVMAHDRVPPDGYLQCYQANVSNPISKFIVGQRAVSLQALVPGCEDRAWPVTKWRLNLPEANLTLAPAAEKVIDNIWTQDPLFIKYVPSDQAPIQPAAQLVTAFEQDFHDFGCLVFPAPDQPGGYQFAFLPSNLRYAPEELMAIFPWADMVDFQRTGQPLPYGVAYALAAGGPPPAPGVGHDLSWPAASLIGYSLPSGGLQAGGQLELTLHLQVNRPAAVEEWFRLTLVNQAQPDTPLAVDQGDPCRGTYPAPLWQPGQVIMAKSILAVPDGLPASDYVLRLSMFDLPAGPDTALPAVGDATIAHLHLVGP